MKMLYVTTIKNDNEFTMLKTEGKEEAVKEARLIWNDWTRGDRKTNRLEIRDYVEDVEDEDCECFDYDTIPWQIWTANRETGDLIEQCESMAQAERLIEEYEQQDKDDEAYEPNFYDIVNEDREHINKTSKAQLRAGAKYDKANTRFYGFKLNKETDKDIIEILDRSPNKQALFKMAMREFAKKIG